MTIKSFIQAAISKKKKTELSHKDERKIITKFWDLVEEEFRSKEIEYDQATQNVFDSIEGNFSKYFPEYSQFEEKILEIIFNNK